ncbi:hypothetical protein LDENG_00185590 [Lucifuga dentata]|nr:hypothetical protein LDENG_00185590 [Lucifuga dentata]
MVVATQENLKGMVRDFKHAADKFVQWTNERIKEQGKETEVEVETGLPQKGQRREKGLSGETTHDEALKEAKRAYEVNVHNQILDTAVEPIHRRFLTHGTLCADLPLLDPRNYPHIMTSTLAQSALQDLSRC